MEKRLSSVGNNVVGFTRFREVKETVCRKMQQKLHVTEDFVNRLGLESELEGHGGCVNCLEWDENGRFLASASDDVQVILWDPFLHKKVHTIQTGHHGNIFSVKFLPRTNNNVIVTGAGDSHIKIHDVVLRETRNVCNCHMGRVKRLATAPNVSHMFWSAAEDGTVMQFDLRMPHVCSRESNVLVNLLSHMGRCAEAKCLSINPCRPELLAVGANDPYIRLYDRRMIKPTSIDFPDRLPTVEWERRQYLSSQKEGNDNIPLGCVQYFVAGHLPMKQKDYKKKYRNLASTFLTFSSDGNELLVNLGGEQIYLFDINNKRRPNSFNMDILRPPKETPPSTNGYSNGYWTTSNMYPNSNGYPRRNVNNVEIKKPSLPLRVEDLKLSANNAFENKNFTLAISLYNKAISLCPSCAILYGNRAVAYMKRSWDGDIYSAMRDCHIALQLDPNHLKAHFRLARCLYELHWIQEASQCLQIFKSKFPDQAETQACKALDKDIQIALSIKQENEEVEEPESSGSASETSDSPEQSSRPKRYVTSSQEKIWREMAYDYETRFCGHCNTTTDIKEANFFGNQGQYIVAGSDDGSFFIWDRKTTNILRVLRGDESIVNCLQPHPSYCLLATSGIDPVVRLWSPRPEDGSKNDREVMDLDDAASANQKRMNTDPFEVMLLNMGYRITSSPGEPERRMYPGNEAINCRTS